MNNLTDSNPRIELIATKINQSLADSPGPVSRWLNGTLLDVRYGYLKVKFVVREDMTNPMGILHGGIAATIMDEMAGANTYLLGRENAFTTVNLNCDYLHSAQIGETIIAESTVIRAGNNVVHCESKIMNEAGLIVAKCSTNLIKTNMKLST
jgi:acyl-coenzyme A thioesterase 13